MPGYDPQFPDNELDRVNAPFYSPRRPAAPTPGSPPRHPRLPTHTKKAKCLSVELAHADLMARYNRRHIITMDGRVRNPSRPLQIDGLSGSGSNYIGDAPSPSPVLSDDTRFVHVGSEDDEIDKESLLNRPEYNGPQCQPWMLAKLAEMEAEAAQERSPRWSFSGWRGKGSKQEGVGLVRSVSSGPKKIGKFVGKLRRRSHSPK